MPSSRTLRFHTYGEPADVLVLDEVEAPAPGRGQVRVRVRACGVNPADWALCRGLFAGDLPRGIGLEVAGVVDSLGEGVGAGAGPADAAVGDLVLGTPDWSHLPSAGAADLAVLEHWVCVPEGLDPLQAAALPMATVTAHSGLDVLGVRQADSDHARQVVLVHGAGTTVGFAAVQVALARGATVLATAGSRYAEQLRALGAQVTGYGDGMVERVRGLAGGPVDLVLDTAPTSGVLPDLIRCTHGDPAHVVTVVDHAAAAELGVRSNLDGTQAPRYDVLGPVALLAAQGLFTVPVAQTFDLADWPAAMQLSLSGRAGGKLLLLP